ncbi:MAG: exodeoxyribonuclease VII small subunit [Candidatus Margulisbacteria bacterium]|nr:exodeoxyribonuclease VII small subunit [Candidatus Margulisiibacteriota bacterium]
MTLKKDIETLESFAHELENEDIDLEKAMSTYKKAVKLAESTFTSIKKSEDTLKVLRKEGEKLVSENYHES